MLTIRDEQTRVLSRHFDARLVADMGTWLMARIPDAAVAGAGDGIHSLQDRTAESLRRSRRCGLTAMADHRSYLLMSAVLGWDFHTRPQYRWIEACLSNPALGMPGDRMADVLDALRGQLQPGGASA